MENATEAGFEGFGKSLGEVVAERFSNPLVISFVTSWILWNFKFFVILFSENSVTVTYQLIQEMCFPNPFLSIFNGLIAPLALTVAYIYYLPYFSKKFYAQWKQTQEETKAIRLDKEGQTLLSEEESREMRARLRNMYVQLYASQNEADKLREDLQHADLKRAETIKNTNATPQPTDSAQEDREPSTPVEETLAHFSAAATQKPAKTKKSSSPKPPPASTIERVTSSQEELLTKIARARKIQVRELEAQPTNNPVLRDYDIQQLTELGFIETAILSGYRTLSLTQRGRQYVLTYELF